MSQRVLITGATGLVGQALVRHLQTQGYEVAALSRKAQQRDGVTYYAWDLDAGTIDAAALEGTDYIIHLAGAGVADSRWSAARKKVILESRTKSTALLRQYIKEMANPPKAFIAASAIGLYGSDQGDQVLHEDAPAADDFLAQVTTAWEAEADQVAALGIRTVKVRIGVVLAAEGGALEKLAKPIRLGAGAALASGAQYMSWIHIADLVAIFARALQDQKMEGAYNAVAPNPATNKEVTKAAANALSKPILLPNVPTIVLKLMFGEMASILTGSIRVAADKLLQQGFTFSYPTLQPAMNDLLRD